MSIITETSVKNTTLTNLIYFYPVISTALTLTMGSAGIILSLIVAIFFFVKDRKYLRSINAFVPHWGWFFILLVYVYKRQNRNGWDKKYFWYYLLLSVVLFVISFGIGMAQGPYVYQ